MVLSRRDGSLVVDAQGERIELVALASEPLRRKGGGAGVPFEASRGGRNDRVCGPWRKTRPREPSSPSRSGPPLRRRCPISPGITSSDELQSVFRFESQKGTLLLRHRPYPAVLGPRRSPTPSSGRTGGDSRAVPGRSAGLTLDAGRLRGLTYGRSRARAPSRKDRIEVDRRAGCQAGTSRHRQVENPARRGSPGDGTPPGPRASRSLRRRRSRRSAGEVDAHLDDVPLDRVAWSPVTRG